MMPGQQRLIGVQLSVVVRVGNCAEYRLLISRRMVEKPQRLVGVHGDHGGVEITYRAVPGLHPHSLRTPA